MQDATAEIVKTLKARKYRITKVRMELISLLAQAQSPRTLPEILALSSADEVSVYRNLEMLNREHLLETITAHNMQKQFALFTTHHHHVVCSSCGDIEHVPCSDAALSTPRTQRFFEINDHEVTYYGICTRCA